MRRLIAVAFLILAIVGPLPAQVAQAQELASESYTGSGWSIRWDPKIVRLVSTSDIQYRSDRDGCNLALAYPRFGLCARSFDRALGPLGSRSGDGTDAPADSVRLQMDALFPDAEPVPDDLTGRPAVDADDIAWQLFADSPESGDDDAIRASDAIYIEVRQLSRDERVTLVVTGLTVAEFEAAGVEIDAMLASVQRREPTFTDPTLGWTVSWNHADLRPSAIPDPDPMTSIYLTEYADAYEADGLDIDIWMSNFVVPEDGIASSLDPRAILDDFYAAFESGDLDIETVVDVPEGFETLEVSSSSHASGFIMFLSPAPGLGVPDYWVMVDIRVAIPNRAVVMTLLMWDAPHTEDVLPLFEDFFGSFTLPPIPRSG